ncbi:MAG: pyridine nucleotide-disulfide oxidoreductase, partial [Acidimicrobiia bacterium]
QLVPRDYRNPSDLPPGGVLVVGASATGTQLADEFTRDGRRVVIAAGDHSRAPRRYRGRDLFFWLDRSGILDVSIDAMPDRAAAARAPSLQVVGGRGDLDLGTLAARGVTRAGRLLAADGAVVRFADNLPASVAASEHRLTRVLDRIDRYIDSAGFADTASDPDRPEPIRADAGPLELNLRRAGINTVVWATGYRRDYSWLRVGVLDGHGEIEQRGGVTAAPGLYVIGLRFQTRRNSNFIDGVGHDARAITAHIVHRTGATEVPSHAPTPVAV